MKIIKSILNILQFIVILLCKKKAIIAKVFLMYQQLNVCKRYFEINNVKLPFENHERALMHQIYNSNPNARKFFKLLKPETILYAWKKYLKKNWIFLSIRKPGRPPITKAIKELIKSIKIDNYLWGCRRIRDELKKLSIDVSRESIRKVIQDYRRSGDIKPNLSWDKFLKAHWQSLFSCDFFTVDIFGFKRLYVFFIIELKSRKIVHYNVTTNPTISFLRNQFSHFEEQFPNSYLIHDNSGELKWFPYKEYDIKDIATTPYSPNMNAYAERFVRSVRNECLDWFIIFNLKQLRNILKEYIYYYNQYRPHQGLKAIPDGKPPDRYGKIKKKAVLFGLHHHYFREAV